MSNVRRSEAGAKPLCAVCAKVCGAATGRAHLADDEPRGCTSDVPDRCRSVGRADRAWCAISADAVHVVPVDRARGSSAWVAGHPDPAGLDDGRGAGASRRTLRRVATGAARHFSIWRRSALNPHGAGRLARARKATSRQSVAAHLGEPHARRSPFRPEARARTRALGVSAADRRGLGGHGGEDRRSADRRRHDAASNATRMPTARGGYRATPNVSSSNSNVVTQCRSVAASSCSAVSDGTHP